MGEELHGIDERHRDKNGEISRKHGNTLVGTLRKIYGASFAAGQPNSAKLEDVLTAAQALPVVGAVGGAAVNYAFIEHFQDVARGHFTVRRLERLYGKQKIRSEYDLIASEF
jgi:hypothetical protein